MPRRVIAGFIEPMLLLRTDTLPDDPSHREYQVKFDGYRAVAFRTLTKAKMAGCRWLNPVLVGQFEFVEWTPDDHLRHQSVVGLREDKPARE